MQRYFVTTGEDMNLANLEDRIKQASGTGEPIHVYGEHETTPVAFDLFVNIGRAALKLPSLDTDPETGRLQPTSLLKFSGFILEPVRSSFDATFHEGAESIDLQVAEYRTPESGLGDMDFEWVE